MTISRLVSYAKSVLDDIVKKKEIEEADFEEMLNTENEATVMHSLNDGKIINMVLNTEMHDDRSNDYDNVCTDVQNKSK